MRGSTLRASKDAYRRMQVIHGWSLKTYSRGNIRPTVNRLFV
jgi:hypothetical protein